MTDQHRGDCLGCAGNATIKTPNIDALARDGVLFSKAYTATPSCTPARAALLTGTFTSGRPGRSRCSTWTVTLASSTTWPGMHGTGTCSQLGGNAWSSTWQLGEKNGYARASSRRAAARNCIPRIIPGKHDAMYMMPCTNVNGLFLTVRLELARLEGELAILDDAVRVREHGGGDFLRDVVKELRPEPVCPLHDAGSVLL